jgi:hypothetical protein
MASVRPLSAALSAFLPPPHAGHAMSPAQRSSDIARVALNDEQLTEWEAHFKSRLSEQQRQEPDLPLKRKERKKN